MSKTESMPVASNERDSEDIAAYTVEFLELGISCQREAERRTLQHAEAKVGDKAGPYGDFHLVVHVSPSLCTPRTLNYRYFGRLFFHSGVLGMLFHGLEQISNQLVRGVRGSADTWRRGGRTLFCLRW